MKSTDTTLKQRQNYITKKHWCYEQHRTTKLYRIYSGILYICEVSSEQEAKLIVKSVNK